jgi:tetratricopeptide (TPR) repeat protein
VKDAQHKHWYNLAIECEDEAKPEEALEAYERALEFKEDFAECYYNMVCRHGTLESTKTNEKVKLFEGIRIGQKVDEDQGTVKGDEGGRGSRRKRRFGRLAIRASGFFIFLRRVMNAITRGCCWSA